MKNIIEIEHAKRKYNLNIASDAIDFLLFLFKEENHSINSREILKQANKQSDNETQYELDYIEVNSIFGDFFEPYITTIDADNCFHQYFMVGSTNDLIKQQKLDIILKGLTNYIDWLWHRESVSTFNQWVEFEFKDGLFNLPEYEGLRNATILV